MTDITGPPSEDELELTLLGPGYGEAIALHVGYGTWVLVDSCLQADGTPRTLEYLQNMGVDPANAVALVVATHWHDDHIRGMAQLVERCASAAFCCSGALRQEEFLSVVGRMEANHMSRSGSGVREIHRVFSGLRAPPTFAAANRRLLSRNGCEVWSLSPNDGVYQQFLDAIGNLAPKKGQQKSRIRDLSPNGAAVVLWIRVGDVVLLLGSDLEKPGWIEILQDRQRPQGGASAFKIPHHGAASAHVADVWTDLLESQPVAVLTPWRRGGRSLPSQADVARIRGSTSQAYATARPDARAAPSPRRERAVERTIRESGIELRRPAMSPGTVRLRRSFAMPGSWQVELFGTAYRL